MNPSGNTPKKRADHASCLLGENIVIFGGYGLLTYYNDLFLY